MKASASSNPLFLHLMYTRFATFTYTNFKPAVCLEGIAGEDSTAPVQGSQGDGREGYEALGCELHSESIQETVEPRVRATVLQKEADSLEATRRFQVAILRA